MLIPLAIISVLVLSQQSVPFIIRGWVFLSVTSIENLLAIALQISIVALTAVGYWFVRHYRVL